MGAPLALPSFIDLMQSAPSLPEATRQTLNRLERLANALVPTRSGRDTEEETVALSAFHELAQEMVATMGPTLLLLLREAQGDQLRSLILTLSWLDMSQEVVAEVLLAPFAKAYLPVEVLIELLRGSRLDDAHFISQDPRVEIHGRVSMALPEELAALDPGERAAISVGLHQRAGGSCVTNERLAEPQRVSAFGYWGRWG